MFGHKVVTLFERIKRHELVGGSVSPEVPNPELVSLSQWIGM